MAKIETTTVAFELGDEELAAIAPTGGRRVKPSVYLEEVRAAIGTDKAFGIPVPADVKGTYIVSQLHKAAKELNLKLKVWNRSDAAKPFVGYKVVTEPATADAPIAE